MRGSRSLSRHFTTKSFIDPFPQRIISVATVCTRLNLTILLLCVLLDSSLYPHDLACSDSIPSFARALLVTPPFFFFTPTAMSTTTTTTTTTATQPITADAILRLFPDIDTTSEALSGHDEEQIRLMDEVCIVLDENDMPIGQASKKLCHLMTNIDKGLLHRAFSVFLFNDQNELLLQQRASEKITFPDMWTNTCCSHPLGIPGETGSNLPDAVMGVKRAAQRKLDHELGIKPEQVPIENFRFLTRIHYKAPSDGKWGEHEIDYILFIKANVDLKPSPNEVQATQYVSPDRLKQLFEDPSLKFTPWFKLICNSLLFEWWANLNSGLEKYMNDEKIHRM